jgi:hypothetical protein
MNQRAMEQAVRALALVLSAGNFGVVAFDLGEAPLEAIRRLPFTTWMRLQRLVEGSQTIALLVGPQPMARSAAGLTVRLGQEGQERSFSDSLFRGLAVQGRVMRARVRAHESTNVCFRTAVGRDV